MRYIGKQGHDYVVCSAQVPLGVGRCWRPQSIKPSRSITADTVRLYISDRQNPSILFHNPHLPTSFLAAFLRMDPLQMAQSIVTTMIGAANQCNDTLSGVAQNSTLSPATSTAHGGHIQPVSLLTFLMSFTALHDWLKLIVIGGVIETSRRLCFSTWRAVVDSFWIKAEVNNHDIAYRKFLKSSLGLLFLSVMLADWLLLWLSKQHKWSQ